MSRSNFALFVAVLTHAFLILLFWFLASFIKDVKPEQAQQRVKIALRELENPKKTPAFKPEIQPIQSKHLTRPLIKHKTQKPIPTNPLKQPIATPIQPTPKVEPLPPMEKYIPIEKPKIEGTFKKQEPKKQEIEKQSETQKKVEPEKQKELPKPSKEATKPTDPMAWMKEDRSSEDSSKQKTASSRQRGSVGGTLKELYGDDFAKLTQGQQEYLKDNIEEMRRITQDVLNRVASVNIRSDLNTNSINIIEFKLHPNGDMSDFKFLKNSGYYILDDTTKETISYAYSRYPRPKETITIRYNVYYNLRH